MKRQKSARTLSSQYPYNSVVIQIGVAFVVAFGIALMVYALQPFLR